MELPVYAAIVKAESAWNLKGRNVMVNVAKKDKTQKDQWWPRITKEKVKNQLISIDWARWQEPDDEDEKMGATAAGAADFDPTQFRQMMGAGAMGQQGVEFANLFKGMKSNPNPVKRSTAELQEELNN